MLVGLLVKSIFIRCFLLLLFLLSTKLKQLRIVLVANLINYCLDIAGVIEQT